ncbi:polysaccharide deacetylase family protein [Priestia megaterium]|uniref:polysaccharide deacetylase family protein n=1 Tax=Priestia megaterium TaxID=1404 RepID=UPI000EFA2024|nr:polysaccharide deacetylase family protein [Priestia megaterium]RMA94985.1 peptidoglycan/xylan/chitin deacetylase (PgdA/CDA1 family) [Priestia megaterium]
MEFMISAIIFLILLYTVIPYFLSRSLGVNAVKRGKDLSKIAFTFDDGPTPIYTPILLDLLKKNEVKATFFVVGTKAEKYPELIQRMHNEGHLIGIHNYVHHCNWLMSPWKVRNGLKNTAKVIKSITGVTPIYYRPPWGMLNIFDFIKKGKYKIILWSIMAEDWRTAGGSEKIKKRLANIKGGDVILLHDCGDTFGAESEAPRNTINALRDVLKTVKTKGFTCVRVDELVEKL